MDLNPLNINYLFNYASALHNSHEYDLESQALESCLKLNSNSSELLVKIYNNLAIANECQHKYELAKNTYEKAMKLFPDNSMLLYNHGNLCMSLH